MAERGGLAFNGSIGLKAFVGIEPPGRKSGYSTVFIGQLAEIARGLMKRPGVWAEVASFKKSYDAQRFRQTLIHHHKNVRAACRTDGDTNRVYAVADAVELKEE